MVRCRFWCSSSRWVNGWRRPTAGRRTVPRPCGYVKSSRRPWCRSVPLVGGGSLTPHRLAEYRLRQRMLHTREVAGSKPAAPMHQSRCKTADSGKLTFAAPARKSRPVVLFVVLNLIARHSTAGPDASLGLRRESQMRPHASPKSRGGGRTAWRAQMTQRRSRTACPSAHGRTISACAIRRTRPLALRAHSPCVPPLIAGRWLRSSPSAPRCSGPACPTSTNPAHGSTVALASSAAASSSDSPVACCACR